MPRMPDGTDLGRIIQVMPRILVCAGGEIHAASLIATSGGADRVAGLKPGEARLLLVGPVPPKPGRPSDYRLYAVVDEDWSSYLDLGGAAGDA